MYKFVIFLILVGGLDALFGDDYEEEDKIN